MGVSAQPQQQPLPTPDQSWLGNGGNGDTTTNPTTDAKGGKSGVELTNSGQSLPGAAFGAGKKIGVLSTAELAPFSMKTATGKNTAAAIAGLKPWSKDWVTQGIEGNEDIKPIFGGKEPSVNEVIQGAQKGDLASLEKLGKMIDELGDRRGEAAKAILGDDAGEALAGLGQNGSAMDPEQLKQIASALRGKSAGGALEGTHQQLSGNAQVADDLGQEPVTMNRPGGASAGLSGGEYLSTLSALRANPHVVAPGQGQAGHGGSQDSSGNNGRPDLRLVDGGKKAKTIKGLEENFVPGTPASAANFNPRDMHAITVGGPKMPEVTGHVIKGAGAQDRLSSESLLGVSSGISKLTAQGGEMRVRLRPENLGELHIRVTSNGNDVGLQIRASDDRARKVIEESMNHLKDSLAQQNLSLKSVEVAVAHGASNGFGNEPQSGQSHQQNSGSGQQQQQAFQGFMGSQDMQQQGSNRQSGWDGANEAGSPRSGAAAARAQALAAAGGMSAEPGSRLSVSNGRLDVRA
ncbi:MAG: flagellar hook-length control protein FliK [Bdellovibrionota bacterium]